MVRLISVVCITHQFQKDSFTKTEEYKDGEPDGLCEYFDEEGNLTKSETWENGKLVDKDKEQKEMSQERQKKIDTQAEEFKNNQEELF